MGFNVFDWDMFNWRVTNKYRMTCKHMLPSLKAGTPLYEIRALVNCYWLSCRRTDLFLVEANQGDINTRLSQSFSSSSFYYCTYKPLWSSTKAFPEAFYTRISLTPGREGRGITGTNLFWVLVYDCITNLFSPIQWTTKCRSANDFSVCDLSRPKYQ